MADQMPNLRSTFGAAYIGAMVTLALYGLTTLQTYMYYLYYPKDRVFLKGLVLFVWVIDSVHIVLVCHAMYYYLVANYGIPETLLDGVWSLFVSIAINLLIAIIVQVYFALRIFRLSGQKFRWWLTGFILVLVFAHFALGIETVVLIFIKKKLAKLDEITLIAAMPFALFAVLSDVAIAASLCVLLNGHKTTFKRTKALVNTLIVYAINRCLLTSIVAVVEVIAFATSPRSLWFVAIDFVIGKLYANSFLATLNARHSMRQGLSVGNSSSEGINSIRVENLRFAHGTAVRSSREVRVLGSAGGGIAAHGEGSATDVDIMEMESGSRGKDFKRKETPLTV